MNVFLTDLAGKTRDGQSFSASRLAIPPNRIHGVERPPHFVARGDSWFAFKEAAALPPFKPANLAEAIQELGYSVDILAANALTAMEMSEDNKLAYLRAKLISSKADALLFSGGGDDLFLQNVYPPATASSAFAWFLNPAAAKRLPLNQKRFDRFLSDLHTAIQKIADVATRCHLPCLLHTYAPPIPSGRGAYPYPGFGPWIRPVLLDRGYNPDRDGPAILIAIVERFRELLHAIHGASVEVVDLLPIVKNSDWRDELHLHSAGWRRCALEFQRVFQTIPALAKPVGAGDATWLPQRARQLVSH
jgi:hypothetical protein